MTNCERLLGSADAAAALTVLDWAQETGLKPDPQLVERCGRDVIGPALPAMNTDRRIIRVGQAYPALARGLAAFITASGPDTARRLLRGVAGELLDSATFAVTRSCARCCCWRRSGPGGFRRFRRCAS